MFPSIQVPLAKDELKKWKEDWCDAIISLENKRSLQEYERLYQNRRAYNGELNPKDFTYMTEMYGLRTPARLVGYPYLWKIVEEVVGETSKDTLDFSVESVDEDIITAKKEKKVMAATEMLTRPIRRELANVTQVDMIETGADEDIPDSIAAFEQMDFNDHTEIGMMYVMRHLQQKHNFDMIFEEGMREMAITRRPIYQVYCKNGDPQVRKVNPSRIQYGSYEGMNWLHLAPWVREEIELPINEVIDEYRHVADHLEVAKWEKWMAAPNNKTNLSQWKNVGRYDEESGSLMLRVVKYRWKAINSLLVKESDNPYEPAMPFIKIVDKEKDATSKQEFNEIWQGVWIADNHYDVRPKPNQVRNNFDYAVAHLDYFGCLKPGLSIVDITKNLYIFACIVMYHIEAMLNRAGGKSLVYDVAQKPKNVKLSDVFYHAKESGLILINSAEEGAQLGRGFNQFQTVDYTLSNTVGQLLQLKAMIEQTMSTMTGINPNRMGEGSPEETNRNNDQKILQSNFITQSMFDDHFRVVEDVLNEVLNTTRIVWNDTSERILYVMGERGRKVISFMSEWLGPHFGLWVKNSHKEQNKKKYLMQMAERAMSAGQAGILEVMKMANSSTTKETERIFENAVKAMQKSQAAQSEANMKIEQEKIAQKDREIDSRLKAARIEAEAYIQTKRLEILAESGNNQQKGQIDIQKSVVDAQHDMDKIMVNAKMEQEAEKRKEQAAQQPQQPQPPQR